MPDEKIITVPRKIAAVTIMNSYQGNVSNAAATDTASALTGGAGQGLQAGNGQNAECDRFYGLLEDLTEKINQYYHDILCQSGNQIAKLAVEIARKILHYKVEQKDYQIESIIEQALKSAPVQQQIVVHLNPQDMPSCQKWLSDNQQLAEQIKLVPDISIGPAECTLETSKGIIRSAIEEQLEKIGKALEKVQ